MTGLTEEHDGKPLMAVRYRSQLEWLDDK